MTVSQDANGSLADWFILCVVACVDYIRDILYYKFTAWGNLTSDTKKQANVSCGEWSPGSVRF